MPRKAPPDLTETLPAFVAQRIRAERLRLGLTAEQAAARLSVTRSSYIQLEERGNPTLTRLVELVRKVGMDLRALVPELFPEANRR